ncbi:MAG: hypothetical protein HOP28_15925 [Gemmatimonadales bacterium]|nr:hypothetical protein [Gemmatimonadales bacterium]
MTEVMALEAPRVRLLHRGADIIDRVCELPEKLSGTEWADKYRRLPKLGPFRSDVAPYTRRWMDLGADPGTSLMVLCWATQTLKSTVIENIMGFRIHKRPCDMMLVRPKTEDAEKWTKERFDPMVRATPVLRERVRLGRSSDSTIRYKKFPGGSLWIASAQSATELASSSMADVFIDESDRMEMIKGEGNPLEIAFKRQGAQQVGLKVITSTPRDAETTIIWPYLEGGTFEYYEVPCIHCDAKQSLEWKRLRWPAGRPELAEYECAYCSRMIPESRKADLLHNGLWVPTHPEAEYPSSHLNALYSPFGMSSWGVLGAEMTKAAGKPADLQVFINTRLAELWKETDERALKINDLNRPGRLEPLEQGVSPKGVGVITIGVDIQDNRIEVDYWGWGEGLESWLIDSTVLPGDTAEDPLSPKGVWKDLDVELYRLVPHVSGAKVPLSAGFIDSGHQTTQVYRYCHTRRRKFPWLFASKGVDEGHVLLGKPTVQTKERYILYPIAVNKAKDEFLRSQLQTPKAGPGFVHLPEWLSFDQLEQFLVEERKPRRDRGRTRYVWIKKRHDLPNERLDCRNLARAALERLGTKVIARLAELAEAFNQATSSNAGLPTRRRRGHHVAHRGVSL